MNLSTLGLQFIAGWEELRNQLYDDGGVGVGNCTIGVGHLVHFSPCDGRAEEQPFLNGITNDEAYALMRVDVQRFEDIVNREVTVPLSQNQFDALVDFAYNLGDLLGVAAVVNAGGDVCAELVRYIKPDWASAGLLRRRKGECALYAQENDMTPQQVEQLNEASAGLIRLQADVDGLATVLDALPSLKGQLRYVYAFAGKPWPFGSS